MRILPAFVLSYAFALLHVSESASVPKKQRSKQPSKKPVTRPSSKISYPSKKPSSTAKPSTQKASSPTITPTSTVLDSSLCPYYYSYSIVPPLAFLASKLILSFCQCYFYYT